MLTPIYSWRSLVVIGSTLFIFFLGLLSKLNWCFLQATLPLYLSHLLILEEVVLRLTFGLTPLVSCVFVFLFFSQMLILC